MEMSNVFSKLEPVENIESCSKSSKREEFLLSSTNPDFKTVIETEDGIIMSSTSILHPYYKQNPDEENNADTLVITMDSLEYVNEGSLIFDKCEIFIGFFKKYIIMYDNTIYSNTDEKDIHLNLKLDKYKKVTFNNGTVLYTDPSDDGKGNFGFDQNFANIHSEYESYTEEIVTRDYVLEDLGYESWTIAE